VDLTANENKHHEEEARPHFCCSILFPRSMHQPGYIQEGQGVIFGYLLLGIYHRRIPDETIVYSLIYQHSFNLQALY
jgi:hypothetical protein